VSLSSPPPFLSTLFVPHPHIHSTYHLFPRATNSWITGHSYIVYGPLCNGATSVVFEGLPTYPDGGRYWDMVERLRISQLYTAPTAIRALKRLGDDFVTKYDRSSLRVLGSVGEPINPEAWKWYFEVIGGSRCAVVDTFWQTETGGHMITPLPGATPTKPGSATLPFFGIEPVIIDPHTGHILEGNDVEGVLGFKKPWPSVARSIYGDHPRYLETYMKLYPGYYFTGDGAHRDSDGYYWIRGRVDGDHFSFLSFSLSLSLSEKLNWLSFR